MKILVTGFDPFGGASINPAYEAVKLLPDRIEGAEVIKMEIPTVFGKDEEVIRTAVENIIRMLCYVWDRLVEDPGSQSRKLPLI